MDNEEFPVKHFVRALSVGFNAALLTKTVSVKHRHPAGCFVQARLKKALTVLTCNR